MKKYVFCITLIFISSCQSVTFSKKPALFNGLASRSFGKLLNKQEKELAANAELQALNSNKTESVEWSLPKNSISGTVNAAPLYSVGSQECRYYSHEIVMNKVANRVSGTACKDKLGQWSVLN
jgi:surface antigen